MTLRDNLRMGIRKSTSGATAIFLIVVCGAANGSIPVLSASFLTRQPSTDFSPLEQVIQEEMKAQNVPGAQVAVISGDRVVFQKGFGVANAETNEAVTPETLFRIGSTTKTFVAAAAVTLAEQSKLDLNKPIGNYAKGLHPQIARLTLHQLLSHTAGLKDEALIHRAGITFCGGDSRQSHGRNLQPFGAQGVGIGRAAGNAGSINSAATNGDDCRGDGELRRQLLQQRKHSR